jgi:GNAT superfamily N-acetyltransferase
VSENAAPENAVPEHPAPENVTAEATTPLGPEWNVMTFPAFRHLLALLGTGHADARGVSPVARYALLEGRPVGLLLAELPTAVRPSAELLSLFVAPDFRGRSLASRLLAELEIDLVNRGVRRITGSYMTGKPAIAALERVFAKSGFSAPVVRTVAVRFTPEEAARTDWYRRARLPADGEIFPWSELTGAERAELRRSQAEENWIHPELEPWNFDQHCDPVSSVGLRRAGKVVGWVINHRIAAGMVRFTISFVRRDLARRGGIFPLYVASLERLKGTGVTCTFVTASNFESMNRFVLRRCAPFISFSGETRGVSKDLAGDASPQ